MKVKTFRLNEEDKANEFIQSVVLLDEGSVQVTSDNTIVIFYKEFKENYESYFVAEMIESLKRNLFHEQIRAASFEAEIEVYRDKGGKSEGFDDVLKRSREATENIRMFENKIAALETWTASNISKT